MDEVRRAFTQGPGRGPRLGIALDAAANRVRRVPGDAGQGQGPRIHPGGMAVGRIQHDGPAGDHGVEGLFARIRLREERQVPAPSGDPGGVRMGRGVSPDLRQDLLGSEEPVQIAETELHAPGNEMDMGVLKGRQDQAASEIDDPGRRASPLQGPAAVPDVDDLSGRDRQGFGARPARGHGRDRGVRQDEVGPLDRRAAAGRGQDGGCGQKEEGGVTDLRHGLDLLSGGAQPAGPCLRRRSMAAAAVRASPMARMTVAPPLAMSPPA